jgi:hypothetical protein
MNRCGENSVDYVFGLAESDVLGERVRGYGQPNY